MKPIASVRLATWMLVHLTSGPHREAITGDLLEELRHGRSARWYRRQVFSAITISLIARSRKYTQPLAFSFGWSLFYPVWWLSLERSQFAQGIFAQCSALDWPYSTASPLLCKALPAIAFVWLGFFVYLLSQPQLTRSLSKLHLLRSLSLSFNVLLGIWILFRHTVMSTNIAHRETLLTGFHLIAVCVPFALSLFSAISSARPQHRNTASLAG